MRLSVERPRRIILSNMDEVHLFQGDVVPIVD